MVNEVGLCMAEWRPATENCTSEEESSSSGDEEITWNVNEREKRVVIQKSGRNKCRVPGTNLRPSATALKDDEFWSSNLHDTWEEDPDDSSISFDSEDEEDAQWQVNDLVKLFRSIAWVNRIRTWVNLACRRQPLV